MSEKILAFPTKFGRQYLIVDAVDVDLTTRNCKPLWDSGKLHWVIKSLANPNKQMRLSRAIADRFMPVAPGAAAHLVGFRNGLTNDLRRSNLYRMNRLQARKAGGSAFRQDRAAELLMPGWSL